MVQSDSSADGRKRWILRVLPASLLAMLYGLVVLEQIRNVIEQSAAVASEPDWALHLLLAFHSTSVALFFGVLAVVMFTRKEPVQRERRLIGWVLPFAVTISMSAIGVAGFQEFPTPVLLLATTFVLLGTGLTLYSLRFLGRHFGVVSDVRGLVTDGPYAYVRHPLYGGETITSIGLVLAAASPITLMLFAVGTTLQFVRAKVEEQALTRAFPDYREYAERTPMLIPFMILPRKQESHREADPVQPMM